MSDTEAIEKRSVLFISYYYPPMGLSGVQRTLKFSKYLPEYNWKPIILSVEPNHYFAYDDEMLNELGDDVLIYRTESKNKNKNRTKSTYYNLYLQNIGRYLLSFVNIPDSKAKWKKQAIALGEKIIKEHKIDVIYATAPPYTDFLVALELSKKFDIPFVVDYRDLWVDNKFNFFPTPYHKNRNEQLEHEILVHANRIIVITRTAKETLLKRYKFLNHLDISIITHGYDKEDFDKVGAVDKVKEKLVITHSGMFQDDRTPKYFLKALSEAIKVKPEIKDKIEIRFVGLMRPSHTKLISKLKLEQNCKLYDYVTHSESIRHLLESDVLWLMMKDTVRTPGKLYEYIGAGKPILINAPIGSMRQLASESGLAFVTDPDDIKQITEEILKIYDLWKTNDLPKPNKDFINLFNRQQLTASLAKELALACKV
ncbi:MAG TPA: glycosyltransferase family 4 protein [Candidatus Kapabacteria bacterium]|nr:glycosyltransferase family 4 protein [Candidatus Kapabacteria bacterium]